MKESDVWPEVMTLTVCRLPSGPFLTVRVTGPWASVHLKVKGLPGEMS